MRSCSFVADVCMPHADVLPVPSRRSRLFGALGSAFLGVAFAVGSDDADGSANEVGVGSAAHDRYFCDPVRPDAAVRDPPEKWPLCAPHFIVIGAEKSGTTSVFEYLKAHPDFLPVNKTYLLDRKERARLVATLAAMREQHVRRGNGRLPPMLSSIFDVDRMRRNAGGLTAEEVQSAQPGDENLMRLRPQEIESFFAPVRVGKEVRYWTPSFSQVCTSLGINHSKAYGAYLDVFPRVPAAPPAGRKLPAHLAGNYGKVIGEASPQYFDVGRFIAMRLRNIAPSTRLLVLLREPVRRFRSQAVMIHHMKGTAMDPTYEDFEDNVQRCVGNLRRNKVHPTVHISRVPGGGAIRRVQKINWERFNDDDSDFMRLEHDVNQCWSHGLGKFLLKGIYFKPLHHWLVLREYPSLQVFVMPSEELYADAAAALNRISIFLGLRKISDEIWRQAARYRYSPLFHPSNATFELKVEQVKDSSTASFDELASATKSPLKWTEGTEDLLYDFYAEANCPLRKLLSMDWSAWGWGYCDGPLKTIAGSTDKKIGRKTKRRARKASAEL